MALVLGAFPPVTTAGQTHGGLRISLTVLDTCNVQTPTAAVANASAAAIDVSCTRGTPAAVYLEGGRVQAQAAHVVGQGLNQAVRLRISGSHITVDRYEGEEVVSVMY